VKEKLKLQATPLHPTIYANRIAFAL